jgi:hypothetical protein
LLASNEDAFFLKEALRSAHNSSAQPTPARARLTPSVGCVEQNIEATPPQAAGILVALRRFFANPIVGIAGSIASIVGLVVAIYFFAESKRHRAFFYLVHPAKAVIVKAGQLSRIAVNLDGNPIDTDVTAAQVAFWNAGNEAIRHEHVLRKFTIQTQPAVPIIDATVRKTNREVVHVELDRSRLQHGELGVDWNILEHGDGGIVQVVFAGGPGTDLLAVGVTEGQPSVRRLQASRTELSDDSYTKRNRVTRFLALTYVGVAILVAGVGLMGRRRRQEPIDAYAVVTFVGVPLLIIGALREIVWVAVEGPPNPDPRGQGPDRSHAWRQRLAAEHRDA